MDVNYTLVLIATILQFILGAVWYSPLMFGKWWMEIMEMSQLSPEELKRMQKEMAPFYGAQLLLTLFSTIAFANLLPYVTSFSPLHVAFWIWIGFIAPTQIGTVLWGRTQKRFWVKQIFVMLSYQLIATMLMAWVVTM